MPVLRLAQPHSDFSNNRLFGLLPVEYSRLTALVQIDLSNNSLTGSTPASYGSLTRLTSLDLSHNQLSGTLPPRWSALMNLNTLRLNVSAWLQLQKSQHICSCSELAG